MSKLNKRKYPAVVHKDNGKWFTGYCEEYIVKSDLDDWRVGRYPICEESDEHITKTLSVKYKTYERGRSAANIVLEDNEGFPYSLSMSSFDKLMTASNDPNNQAVTLNANGWFIGEFMQIKQGSNYFISVVEG